MQTDNQLYMRSFLDLPERTQNLAKLKFEVKMLTDTMEHILHDILHVGNFTDSLNLISNMKKLQEIQNMTMNNSRERKWLFESMLKQLKTRDGEDIYPGDVADYVDEVLYEKMNRKLEKRYHKSVINSKMDQTWQRVYLNETQLLEIINDYRSKYQYEIAASMSIKDANEQLIHSIDPYSENKVALLRAALLLNVITRYRNELKILMITVPVHVFPPWTLFSWSLQQFRNRMATDIPSYLDAFEANSDEVKNMAKINAELATLIGIGNFFIEDILGFGVDFSDSMIAIRNMKSLLHIENQYFKEYQEKSKTLSWMYEKLESYDLIVTGERSFSSNHMRMNFEEDDSDLEEDIINHWTNTEVENRYRRAYLKLQKKQIEQKTQNAEDLLLTNISNYIYKYQNEESAFRSIKHVNQNIINVCITFTIRLEILWLIFEENNIAFFI
ncbi:unnamed protein product [Hermetia illucens]|uniref:Uncharacterized protein n=1 Tax=Hermetia illucens TaxID=343691 RepID=A0A7R8UEA3_HERIL|nr:unnamed protein product [Hermetia illucens]